MTKKEIIMDNDAANPSGFAIKRVDETIDLAIVDIFNSKKKIGFIADPDSSSSLLKEVRAKWINLTDEEKEYLTEQIKRLESNHVFRPKVSNQDIARYFTKYVLPCIKTDEIEHKKEKRLAEILIWANEIYDTLKTIKKAKAHDKHHSKLRKNEKHEHYLDAVHKFYSVYGNPSKRELRILKFKLLFKQEKELLKHLLKEKQNWIEISETFDLNLENNMQKHY